MNSERGSILLGLVLWLGVGAGLAGLERRLAPAADAGDEPGAAAFAALGPAAGWVADWGWLQANLAWERRKEEELRGWLRAVRAARPEADYFRVNSARMLAHDLPAWRHDAQPAAPAAVVAEWRRAGAREALAWLEAERHGRAVLWIEAGDLAWQVLRDRDLAIVCYGRAAALPGAPWHAGRQHARLLIEAGRMREARDFLRAWVPHLPASEPAAQRALLEERLAALERELEAEGF